MTRMSLALVLALAVGSYSAPGQAQNARTNASAKHATPAHKSAQTSVPKVAPKPTKKRVKAAPTIPPDPAVEPEKAPIGTPAGLFDFTG